MLVANARFKVEQTIHTKRKQFLADATKIIKALLES
jgi:hypothetical protein